MRKNTEISEQEYKILLQQFYEYFADGYAFEEFLKVYLERIGLDEVSVTQRSRDGGIDLKATRSGIGGFSQADSTEYYVQAKKYSPTQSIAVTKIRELKGTIPFGHKGLLITTAKFSKDAVKESNNDPSKPVILVDGIALINSCIDNEIGFVFNPQFSKAAMDKLTEKNISLPIEEDSVSSSFDRIVVEKQISSNDIRARILPIPKVILAKIPPETNDIEVSFNGVYKKVLTINRGRNYFAGITEAYRKFGLISEDGSFNPAKSVWVCENDSLLTVTIKTLD